MRAARNEVPSYYNSVYRHGVDEKRRVQIPAKWRLRRRGQEFTLIVWPPAREGTCLRVYPPEQMERIVKQIEGLESTDPKKLVLKRFIGANSEQAPADREGRICLPKAMAEVAGIEGEAVLVGLLDCFEIWRPERFEQVVAADRALAASAFGALA